MASNTSVLGSKNVSGVHCVAPGYADYFYKDVNVSFPVCCQITAVIKEMAAVPGTHRVDS